jgi:GTP-binding protein
LAWRLIIVAPLSVVFAGVSDTICAPEVDVPLATHAVDPPTIAMTFGANDSPLAGKEGKFVTGNHVKGRLQKELENNVSILLRPSPDPESVEVRSLV